MSVTVKTTTKPCKFLFWNTTKTYKTCIYEGKVVSMRDRIVDLGFDDGVQGCYVTLEKDGKFIKLQCSKLPIEEAKALLLHKNVRTTKRAYLGIEDFQILSV